MKTYTVKCPICGTINQNLNLEETDGWMKCIGCKTEVKPMPTPKQLTTKIPVYTSKQLVQLYSKT